MPNKLTIERLSSDHDVSHFDCGETVLNDYLTSYAFNNQKMRISVTYVAIMEKKVVGFYSITFGSIQHDETTKKVKRGLPKYGIPVFILARLAIHKTEHSKGLGSGLLKDALIKALKASDEYGIRAVLVHAKNQKAVEFYKKYDFEPSPIDEKHLFLTIKDIEKNYSP